MCHCIFFSFSYRRHQCTHSQPALLSYSGYTSSALNTFIDQRYAPFSKKGIKGFTLFAGVGRRWEEGGKMQLLTFNSFHFLLCLNSIHPSQHQHSHFHTNLTAIQMHASHQRLPPQQVVVHLHRSSSTIVPSLILSCVRLPYPLISVSLYIFLLPLSCFCRCYTYGCCLSYNRCLRHYFQQKLCFSIRLPVDWNTRFAACLVDCS